MPFAYYDRLTPEQKRVYRKSDAIVTLALPAGANVGALVIAIRGALSRSDPADLKRACQALCDELIAGYHVPPLRVVVLARRPSDDYGELHGYYEPAEGRRRAVITVWMRTAARQQVVAFRTFLRTLVHELCHHLDYELFALEETFHTEGFYKRESSLSNALFDREAAGAPSY
jgi:hypothetical protein